MAVVTAHNQLVEVEPEQTVATCMFQHGREEGDAIKHKSLGTIEHFVKSALYRAL